MSFLRLPEPVMVVVEPAAIVFGTTSLTTTSVEASPQSLKDTRVQDKRKAGEVPFLICKCC